MNWPLLSGMWSQGQTARDFLWLDYDCGGGGGGFKRKRVGVGVDGRVGGCKRESVGVWGGREKEFDT